MSLNGILRRASSFLGITGADPSKQMYEDGDIVFCKNNVCVHPPSRYRCDGERVHHPGYLVIKCRADSTLGTTLHLNWIPNDRLRRNHELISQMKYVGLEGSSSSNSPCPTSDSESLSVSSLVLHDGNSTVRKTSLDDAAMSTSGISSMDTASEVTQPKDENSPNSEGSSSVEQPKEKDEGDGVETIESGDPSSEEREERKNEEATSEGEGERNDTWATVENEEKRDEDMGEEKGAKSISDEEENTETGDEITKDSQESEQSDLLASNEEGAEDRDDEDSREDSGSSGDVEEVDKEGTLRARDMHKLRYISSDSSSDGEKPAETLTIAKGKGNPLQGPQLQSEGDQYWYERSAESMAYSANLAFPDSSLSSFCPTPVDGGSSPIRREHKCGIFSIDVSQCRSLRLFFSDREHTCGQLVIASQESQYKIFHFHHGGLDKLASVFEDWNFLVKPQDEEGKAMDSALKQFMVCRPQVSESECHPEEGQHPRLDAELWITYFSEDGMIEDDLTLRRAIFFGGVEPQLRANVWPFLLHYYDYRTTFVQRQAIMEEKHQIYEKINLVRENMSGEERDWFMRNVQCTVEKDVVRTDRSNPCFAGNDNPNLEKMKRILLNFAVHNPVMGYTQGMSDILAPILAEVRNEADVFWCFTGLMSKTIFVTSPKDEDMEKNLSYLRELLRIMVPRFYNHMASQQDGMDLLFCHRWILLCFKREFPEDEALAMWEACWSNYQTDYFHLFLVVAIVSMYGNDVVDQNLRPDETLLYFTSLANHMDGRMALQKARGLLHQYRSMSHLPCTLVGLCELCGPGMWDSGHVPVVTCVGHPDDKPCPLNQPSSNTDGNTSSTTAS
ncbi:TBC1 domain family member 16-like isoform X3 [Penaeus monodon]|uniref:TBC1 domain family member 16-like isoform X3 n=1 Tax=Penaeus monodon TaxID=6687 RepID=UPI0018A73A43|nr:TBC1 domain family member 16-like isoform X3 [Penaeus monodon]